MEGQENYNEEKQGLARNLVSCFFVATLVGLAFQNMVQVSQDCIKSEAIDLRDLLLQITFFFTALRFFIGNQLHLISDFMLKARGRIWLYDFSIIVLQSVILAFIGQLASIRNNQEVLIDFYYMLIGLYFLDVFWIISQEIFGMVNFKMKRPAVPWIWAIINVTFLTIIVVIKHLDVEVYSSFCLIFLSSLSFIAFVVDVIIIDYYDVVNEVSDKLKKHF